MTKNQKKKFDVFLCHNSQDKPKVIEIGRKLQEQGLKPWLDQWELQPGLPWQRELERQIQNISSAAVFVGEGGIGPWQQMEIEAYLRRFVSQGSPVIPVLLPNAPEKPELPIFLGGMTWVDFRHSQPEPLARLIWGITGEKRILKTGEPISREENQRNSEKIDNSGSKKNSSKKRDLYVNIIKTKERELSMVQSQLQEVIGLTQQTKLFKQAERLAEEIDELYKKITELY